MVFNFGVGEGGLLVDFEEEQVGVVFDEVFKTLDGLCSDGRDLMVGLREFLLSFQTLSTALSRMTLTAAAKVPSATPSRRASSDADSTAAVLTLT